MPDPLTLTTIVLGELVFVLLLTAALLGVLLRRERLQQQRLLAAYQRLRDSLRSERARQNTASGAQREEQSQTTFGQYLEQLKSEAQERYHSITQANLPRLAPEQPFSAKVAALRYLYCEAEERAFRKTQASGDPWGLLEKQLYDIVRWIAERQPAREGRQRNNQIKLLQQRVEKLKGFEKLSRDLQRKLTLNQNKREELEQVQRENQITIDKLRHINDILSLSQDTDAGALKEQLQKVLHSAPEGPPAHQERRMTNIEHFAADNQRLHADLIRGFRDYTSEYPSERTNEQRETLEHTIRRLEAELYRSQQHIKALGQHEPPPIAKSGSEPTASLESEEGRSEAMSHIEETLKVIHTNMADSVKSMNTGRPPSAGAPSYSRIEIQQLRQNNTRQRNLIVDLQSELTHLQEALPANSEPDDQQRRELGRLEQLVKECEHCILALESEVDMLYNQLHEPPPAPEPDDESPLRKELEAMASRLEQTLAKAEQDATLSEFAQLSLQAQTPEELAMAMIDTLKRARLTAGFVLDSVLGKAEYFPSKSFSEREHELVRTTTTTREKAYLNEGILFVHHHVHLLLKNPSSDPAQLQDTEALLHALLTLASARAEALALTHTQQHQSQALNEWSTDTHNTLVNMEIRYAFQAEETQRLVDTLAEQMRRVAAALKLNEAKQTVIDNALHECQARVRHLFNEDDTLENGFDHLLSEVEALPKTLQQSNI
ncbi:hypothetical protein [Marinimicrobium agarilyticum]|uniref:hypothetical protein n=1 Tax=Marinimicrobium agarilyticum TaxID=306546 RepID=UPI000407CAA8|nr:hypothetical protein [Marinimicrobium agarilyticum]